MFLQDWLSHNLDKIFLVLVVSPMLKAKTIPPSVLWKVSWYGAEYVNNWFWVFCVWIRCRVRYLDVLCLNTVLIVFLQDWLSHNLDKIFFVTCCLTNVESKENLGVSFVKRSWDGANYVNNWFWMFSQPWQNILCNLLSHQCKENPTVSFMKSFLIRRNWFWLFCVWIQFWLCSSRTGCLTTLTKCSL